MAGIVAGVGLALSAASMGMSFLQAGKQKRLGEKAERDAEKMMDAARKKLDVNYLDALAINKLPYELEREALLVQGAMGVDAARESERGAVAGVGRIQLAQQQGQQGIRSAMSQELIGLDRAAAQEDSRLRDVGVQLDLGEVAGAQMASADASQAAAAATTQGFQQLASFGAQALEAAPLYSKSAGVRQFNKGQRQANREGRTTYMKANPNKGFLGTNINSGYRQASAEAGGRQGVLNKSMLKTLNKSGFDENRFISLKGNQGLSRFSSSKFEANPQSYINRGSVQQQAYLQNLLYGTPMNVGGPIEVEGDQTGFY